MKNYFIIYLMFLPLSFIFSQNLVQNPSFEDYSACPTRFDEIENATHWTSPIHLIFSNPDFRHVCATGTHGHYVDVPTSITGYQFPKTGAAYAGIVCYDSMYTDYREYLQGELISPLVAGNNYTVSFWISLADYSKTGVSNIGVYFTDTKFMHIPTAPPNVLPVTPQLDTFLHMGDTATWIKLEWEYTAAGGEEFLVIGNFEDDNSTTVFVNILAVNYYDGYYYIDDVSVVNTNTSIQSINELKSFNIFPNPAGNRVNVNLELEKSEDVSIGLFNTLGQQVFDKKLEAIQTVDLDVSTQDLPQGIYFVNIKVGELIINKELILIK